MSAETKSDFVLADHGSIFILLALTPIAQDWVDAHLPDDAQHFGRGTVVEHRYIGAIVDGIQADGLTVSS